jgi:hypothetical protein
MMCGVQSLMYTHFKTAVSNFCDWFSQIGMRLRGWWVSLLQSQLCQAVFHSVRCIAFARTAFVLHNPGAQMLISNIVVHVTVISMLDLEERPPQTTAVPLCWSLYSTTKKFQAFCYAFSATVCSCHWYFRFSVNHTSILYWKWILMFMTVLLVPMPCKTLLDLTLPNTHCQLHSSWPSTPTLIRTLTLSHPTGTGFLSTICSGTGLFG